MKIDCAASNRSPQVGQDTSNGRAERARRPFPFVSFSGIDPEFVLQKWAIESWSLEDYKTARNEGKDWVEVRGIGGRELTERRRDSTIVTVNAPKWRIQAWEGGAPAKPATWPPRPGRSLVLRNDGFETRAPVVRRRRRTGTTDDGSQHLGFRSLAEAPCSDAPDESPFPARCRRWTITALQLKYGGLGTGVGSSDSSSDASLRLVSAPRKHFCRRHRRRN